MTHGRRIGAAILLAGTTMMTAPATQASAASGRPLPTLPVERGPRMPAPLLGTSGVQPDGYIVVLRKGTPATAADAAIRQAEFLGGRVRYRYTHALHGFAGTFTRAALDAIRHNPRVSYVEADGEVRAVTTQTNATWGLDRIDQRDLPLNQTYTYTPTGSGVKAYIIDTGIRTTHTGFGGRATSGYDSVDGGTADDCNGHGTHVAGTVGSTVYGVAKQVSLVAVRVLNCQGSGTTSQVIAGIDWVTGNHQAGQPAVANMSLGGGANTSLDTAVTNSIADGVTYAVAAGNENTNACNRSPARVANALTTGATTTTDARASYSNYGTCLDLFAPGSSITSLWSSSDSATNTISGTSMAAPHVAGAAALYLEGTPSATPATVRDAIVNSATTGKVTGSGSGSPNRLLYTLFGASPPPPPPPAECGTTYTGSLTGSGDYDYQPNGTYYHSAVSGTHKGCLDGPTGADFDLYLYKWNSYWGTWFMVARSESTSPDETITYEGTAGYYVWEVYAYSGSGSYSFQLTRP